MLFLNWSCLSVSRPLSIPSLVTQSYLHLCHNIYSEDSSFDLMMTRADQKSILRSASGKTWFQILINGSHAASPYLGQRLGWFSGIWFKFIPQSLCNETVDLTRSTGPSSTFLSVYKSKIGSQERPLLMVLRGHPSSIVEAATIKDGPNKDDITALNNRMN